MAVCRRCGKTFDYNKRDGVCPKCCFYNRPAGTWQEDQSWIKNYNYEDNSYDVTFRDAEVSEQEARDRIKNYMSGKDENDKGARIRDVLGGKNHKELEGSHVHLNDGRVISTSTSYDAPKKTKARKKKNKAGGAGKPLIGSWFFIIILIYWLITLGLTVLD